MDGRRGYGDPIERDPKLVATDVRERKISTELAERIYGVLLNPPDFTVDDEKTEIRRRDPSR
jgi:N-methylhydantoinase B